MKFYVGMRGQEHKRAIAGPSVREVANVIELRIIPIKLLRKLRRTFLYSSGNGDIRKQRIRELAGKVSKVILSNNLLRKEESASKNEVHSGSLFTNLDQRNVCGRFDQIAQEAEHKPRLR